MPGRLWRTLEAAAAIIIIAEVGKPWPLWTVIFLIALVMALYLYLIRAERDN